MNAGRPVRLYRDGGEQAVHIPAELELPGEEAVMRREGACLILEIDASEEERRVVNRARNDALLALLDEMAPLSPEDDFPEITDGPSRSVDF